MTPDMLEKGGLNRLVYIPTILFLCVFIFVLFSIWSPSTNPDVFYFSYIRFSAILIAFGFVCYFLASLLFAACLRFNATAAYMLVAGTVLLEGVLRLFPDFIPDHLILLLPQSVQSKFAAERGFFTHEIIDGEGMLFAYKPGTRFPKQPWVDIDDNGYRNPALPAKQVEVIVLGASVVLDRNSEKDLAQLFRESGMTAYSLGMGSYSPFHYRDAYKKYIVDAGVAHRYVVTLILDEMDINKAVHYRRIEDSGGDYRNFLAPPQTLQSLFDSGGLWTVSIYNKLPFFVAQSIKNLARQAERPEIEVEYAYTRLSLRKGGGVRSPPENGWQFLEQALGDIFAMARDAGATPVLLFYPDIRLTALPHIVGHDDMVRGAEENYRQTVSRLRKFAEGHGGIFLDSTPVFRAHVKETPLTVTPMNYHPNIAGTRLLYRLLRDTMDAVKPKS